MPALSTSALLEVAIAAARAGGTHALNNVSRRTEAVHSYAHDVKLALDVECQQQIEALIRSRFPEHAILGEEDETLVEGSRLGESKIAATGDDGYEWIVDPIDGTVNFSHGIPSWCCSVAVRRGTTILAGAVYAPEMDALYAATVDQPSTRNGVPIHVSTRDALSRCIVMTGMDKNISPGVAPLAFFSRIAQSCRKARIMGSAALDLCWVAQGIADGYFEGSIYLWDIAAAGLIVQQAGGAGEITALRDEPNQMSYVASNGRIQSELKALVAV
jgi:myo-inositol-1(or 4)-monophosphatase